MRVLLLGHVRVEDLTPNKPAGVVYFTWTRKLRGPRWRKLRRQLRRQAVGQ